MDYIKKNWFWLLPLVFAVIAAVWYYKQKKELSALVSVPPDGGLPAGLDGNLLLKSGSRGPEVKYLQAWLNAKGGKLVVDGIFGPNTENALLSIKGKSEIKLSNL